MGNCFIYPLGVFINVYFLLINLNLRQLALITAFIDGTGYLRMIFNILLYNRYLCLFIFVVGIPKQLTILKKNFVTASRQCSKRFSRNEHCTYQSVLYIAYKCGPDVQHT